MYRLSEQSQARLADVHPNLVSCVHRAMSYQIMDFMVAEGARSLQRQKKLVEDGKSRTMLSKHLIQSDGYAHAVDLYPYPVDMAKVHKGDPREIFRFGVLSGMMLRAAQELKVEIINGADWDGDGQTLDHTFFDAPHFQLLRL